MPKKGHRKHRERVGDAKDPLSLSRVVAQYLTWMQGRYRPSTICGREKDLWPFLDWCSLRGLVRPHDITKPILERYQRYLFGYRKRNGKPLSVSSQRSRMTALRSMFRYLARNNHILFNPAADLDLPRAPQRLPQSVLSAAEVEQVLRQVDLNDLVGIRDRAIMETFYSTGIRRTELTHLTVHDLNLEQEVLMVREGKGQKDRMLPIGSRAVAWVERYLDEVRPDWVVEPDPGYLFLNHLGQNLDPGWLTHRIRRYVDKAGIGKHGSCHLFRHTMATLMLEGGADVRFVQAMLGHASLRTTEVYTRVSIRKLKEIHTATHPARLKSRRTAANRDSNDLDASNEETLVDELLSSLAAEEP